MKRTRIFLAIVFAILFSFFCVIMTQTKEEAFIASSIGMVASLIVIVGCVWPTIMRR